MFYDIDSSTGNRFNSWFRLDLTGFWLDLEKEAQVGTFVVGGPGPAWPVVVSIGIITWVTMDDHGILKK